MQLQEQDNLKRLLRPLVFKIRRLKWKLGYLRDTFGKMPSDFSAVPELCGQVLLSSPTKSKTPESREINSANLVGNVAKQPKKFDITVIVPVYNAEKYIEQCLMQVKSSKYKVELIVVDDGQSDKSLDVINKLKEFNTNELDRFLVMHQDNSGAQVARNRALDLQQGEYLLFLDSDDYLTDNTIDILLDTAYKNNQDIVQMEYQLLYSDGNTVNSKLCGNNSYSETSNLQEMFKYPGYNGMKLYRSELFINTRFPEGFWYEDTIIHLVIFPKCRKFQCIQHLGYVYRQNNAGITLQMKGNRKCLDACRIMPIVIDIMEENNIDFDADILQEIKYTLQTVLIKRVRWMNDNELRCIYKYCEPYLQGMQYHQWKGSDL